MSTFSVYNIKVDNELSFEIGATAGYVLSINPDGSTYWANSTGGATGATGTNGTSGTSGTSGTTGTSGTDGTSGTSGTDGTSGTTGTSGTSGSTGNILRYETGIVNPNSLYGDPLQATASFLSPFTQSYNVSLESEGVGVFTIVNKTNSGFVLETNSSSFTYSINWTAIQIGSTSFGGFVTSGSSGTSGVSGSLSGTLNYVPRYTSVTTLSSTGSIYDDGVKVGIGTTTPQGILELSSTSSAFIPTRLTTTQRDTVDSPINGMFIYNSTTNTFNGYQSGTWSVIGGGSNIYSTDGSLTGNRFLTLATKTLSIGNVGGGYLLIREQSNISYPTVLRGVDQWGGTGWSIGESKAGTYIAGFEASTYLINAYSGVFTDGYSAKFVSTDTWGSNYMQIGGDSGTPNWLNRDLSLGHTSLASARLHIKGSGITSATSPLLITDSANNALFKVSDNGKIAMPLIQLGNSGLSTGDLYMDTAANVLANGDYVIGRKS